jgi:hypothetical protein
MGMLSFAISCFFMFQVHNRSQSENTRMMYMLGLAFFMGFVVGPAMHQLAEF